MALSVILNGSVLLCLYETSRSHSANREKSALRKGMILWQEKTIKDEMLIEITRYIADGTIPAWMKGKELFLQENI